MCRQAPPPFEQAIAYGIYATHLRALIHLLKYDQMQPLAQTLGELLSQRILRVSALQGRELLVVPVPLHSSKRRSRGFNQAALIAHATVRSLRQKNAPFELKMAGDALQRKRETASQAGRSPHQRRSNVRGAFFVPRPQSVAGRHILLIDDIYTTGATARACCQALRRAGAASVWVATVARAQLDSARPLQFAQHNRDEPPMEQDVAFWDTDSARNADLSSTVH